MDLATLIDPTMPEVLEAFAKRTRQSVRPDGGRKEGMATAAIEGALPAIMEMINEAGNQATLAAAGEDYSMGPVLNAAAMAVGMPGGSGGLGSTMRYPLYHGSPNTGLKHLEPSVRGPLGPGTYTSTSEQLAGHYAGSSGKTYQLPQKERDIYQGLGHRTDDEWFGFKADKQRLIDAAEPDKRKAIADILDRSWSSDGYSSYQRIAQIYKSDDAAQALFKRAGFEGVSGLVDGPEVLLFGAQQIGP